MDLGCGGGGGQNPRARRSGLLLDRSKGTAATGGIPVSRAAVVVDGLR